MKPARHLRSVPAEPIDFTRNFRIAWERKLEQRRRRILGGLDLSNELLERIALGIEAATAGETAKQGSTRSAKARRPKAGTPKKDHQ